MLRGSTAAAASADVPGQTGQDEEKTATPRAT